MRQPLALLGILALSACASHPYALSIHAVDGESYLAKGTVISVEADGDFVLETNRKMLFVDAKDGMEVELGDRIMVKGTIDNDDDSEAAELDAESIQDWSHGHASHGPNGHDPHSKHPHHAE